MEDNSGGARRAWDRDRANLLYFQDFALTRGSLTKLPMMGRVTAFVLGLDSWLWASLVFYGEHHTELLPVFYGHVVGIGVSLVLCVVTAFRGWVFRFQVFASGLATVFAIVGWVYGISLMPLGIAASVESPRFPGSMMVSGERFAVLGSVAFLYVCGATVVHIVLLRKRLREGHSLARRMGNWGAAASVRGPKSLWIIFGAAVVGGTLATKGEFLMMTISGLGALFFLSVLPSLPVEIGYLTYLKSRDKRYWEPRPPKMVIGRAEVVHVLKKTGKWVLIALAVFIVLVLLSWFGRESG